MVTTAVLVILAVSVVALRAWRQSDHRADARAVARLLAGQVRAPARFDPAMVADLPEPARRFFLYAIRPGTPLRTAARITMAGRFAMGTKAQPAYLDMTAAQTLAAPVGFVWDMSARRGIMRLSGSDSESWTRFWMMGLMPVARMGGDPNHARSAYGRMVAEAVFWTPAAVLPGRGVRWEQVDNDVARVTVEHRGLSQSVDVAVAPDGRPLEVRFERWSNANPEKVYRLQPFGGYLSAFREFAGFVLPTHVEAGNFFGTDRYFPFFAVDVTDIGFPVVNAVKGQSEAAGSVE
ncbi:MAG: hypothetical protein M5U09_11485 [Gammaproteobacteria bacterium]|nr:hypothetical protein [Gammaproteobacteria bacterium]